MIHYVLGGLVLFFGFPIGVSALMCQREAIKNESIGKEIIEQINQRGIESSVGAMILKRASKNLGSVFLMEFAGKFEPRESADPQLKRSVKEFFEENHSWLWPLLGRVALSHEWAKHSRRFWDPRSVLMFALLTVLILVTDRLQRPASANSCEAERVIEITASLRFQA
jgi:hypothetical protein